MQLFVFVIVTIFLTRTIKSAPVHQLDDYEFDYSDYAGEDVSPKSEVNFEFEKFDKQLTIFLDWYYDKYFKENLADDDFDDQMQSDQPVESLAQNDTNLNQTNENNGTINFGNQNSTTGHTNTTKLSPSEIERLRLLRERTKEIWVQTLKDNILRKVGRANGSIPSIGSDIEIQTFNLSQFLPMPNETYIDDESIGEKIRSYYPSCELPRNTDQDVWKDENAMNLYFNVEQTAEENGISIATATLRLYRLPQLNSTATNGLADTSCENSSVAEDDKLLRISIYWYTKSLKKHRVKRRLSDSKVIGESAQYVELSVRPATRAWSKGRNLGLAVLVEDQDGTLLKADKYFKGASCTVGASTPKPIPTVVVDAARKAELERSNGSNGTNSTTALYNYISLLPKIDICTLEFPQNFSIDPISLTNLKINKCNLARIHSQTQKLLEQERIQKQATLAINSPPHRHIRHQRQHLQDLNDPRSRMVGQKIILTNQELLQYNAQLASKNFTIVNR